MKPNGLAILDVPDRPRGWILEVALNNAVMVID